MDGSQSLDHCMLGHVMEWYYGYVGGIRQATNSVGWRDTSAMAKLVFKATVVEPTPAFAGRNE